MSIDNSRPDAASRWLALCTHEFHRFMARPDEVRRASLLNILQQFQNSVAEGRVEPLRYLFPRE